MIYAIYAIIIFGLIVSEIQQEELAIKAFLSDQAEKREKSSSEKFYRSLSWKIARKECFRLQMERTGNDYIECEICGATSMDVDEAGKKVVMSAGHDKARSTHPHLALDQDNLFPQCMNCNIAQGTYRRIR